MAFTSTNETIREIIGVQKEIYQYMLDQQQMKEKNPEHRFDPAYYDLRNRCAGIGIQKSQLVRQKNLIMSYASWS